MSHAVEPGNTRFLAISLHRLSLVTGHSLVTRHMSHCTLYTGTGTLHPPVSNPRLLQPPHPLPGHRSTASTLSDLSRPIVHTQLL
eukprot:scaffold12212_cov122-Isochrysis_galbana.AAC.12